MTELPEAKQTLASARPVLQQSGNGAHYLDHTGGKELVVTFASALGSNCTVMRAELDGTITTLEGQTIGTTYTLAVSCHGWFIFDGPLTVAEKNTVARVLSLHAKRPPPVLSASAPGAPTLSGATAGNGQVVMTLAAPASDGGAAILDYTVTASPSGATMLLTQPGAFTFSGLENGVATTFTATARNSAGTGPASAATAPVTPMDTSPTGSFTGLRIAVVDTVGGSEPKIAELVFRATTGGPALTGTPFASSQSGTLNGPEKAFDGDPATYAQTATGQVPRHFGLTLSSASDVAEVVITIPEVEGGSVDGAPLTMQLEALSDGQWLVHRTFESIEPWTPGSPRTFVVKNIGGAVNGLSNSAFSTTASWTPEPGASITGGRAVFAGTTNTTLEQLAGDMVRVPVAGEKVTLDYDMAAYTQGNFNPRIRLTDGTLLYFYGNDQTLGTSPVAGSSAAPGHKTSPSITIPNGKVFDRLTLRGQVRNGSYDFALDNVQLLIG